jgi:hypothetical protein
MPGDLQTCIREPCKIACTYGNQLRIPYMSHCCSCGAVVSHLQSLNHDPPCDADVERELKLMSRRQAYCPKTVDLRRVPDV